MLSHFALAYHEGTWARRLKIELRDLGRYGFSKGCRKCLMHPKVDTVQLTTSTTPTSAAPAFMRA